MTSELEQIEVVNSKLTDEYVRDVFYICINVGKILLESGAETYRVEDTMVRIAENLKIGNAQVFVTPTVIILSLNDYSLTQTVRIDERNNNFEKVVNLNALSRQIANGLHIKDAIHQLEDIHHTKNFPAWLHIFAAGLISVMFLFLFNGHFSDLIGAAIAGCAGVTITMLVQKYTRLKFFDEFFASAAITIITVLYVSYGFGQSTDTIIISSVMPLVPGVLITNALREMLRGHLMAGVIKGVEACLTAIAIGSGVALVLILLS